MDAQADLILRWVHSLPCVHEEELGPWLPIKLTVKTDQTEADLSLRWVHRSLCGFCHAEAQILFGVNQCF